LKPASENKKNNPPRFGLDFTKIFRAHPAARRLGLPSSIRAATHRALAARDHFLQDCPDWEEWRRRGRAVKAEALARLDELLAELEGAVQGWGGQVLRARDAAQARSLILDVARRHRVAAVVKSKSMTTEEIGLNPALAAAGLRTLETDLGEFIAQLAGHAPAHLTAPALHLNRGQIGQLLAERLGHSPTTDPETLTRRAAAYLKPHYREAQMGITGVNFAAPDGTLVLLENENNLRLTATWPGVHLALMGLEKIIPSLSDVEVLLRLLPPSATGQRLTALVHFLRGLKGSQAFYLVILDNGRRELAADPELSEALYCLHCGACLNICPVFQLGAAHLYGRVYPGAIGILLAPYLAPRGDIADLCTQCGACQEICPVQIRLAENILRLRRRSARFRSLRALSGAAGLVLTRPRLYRGLEPGLRLLAAPLARAQGLKLAPASFQRLEPRREASREPEAARPGAATPRFLRRSAVEVPAAPAARSRRAATLLAKRVQELGASLRQVRGPGALARLLTGAAEPLVLEDHPWLRRLATELTARGRQVKFAGAGELAEGGTLVSVALGAIPETGSVLVRSGRGPAADFDWCPQRQVVLIHRGQDNLSLSQALDLVRRQPPGMITLLTGPSRTADIEKVLVLGAQGPPELELVCYQGEE
jgi:L-lactate dehydrogenase complex protein LldF